jgi:lipopolysaccharide/colanic/teichoic acid biosynthesis glycosyltransferase
MSQPVGLAYTTSLEKLQLDERCRAALAPASAIVTHLAISALSPYHRPDSDSFYYDERILGTGASFALPKICTMHPADSDTPTDAALGFHKENPRIVSDIAHIFRDLAIDELPQINLLPALSMVGPRPFNKDALSHYLTLVASVDSGVAREFEELYHYPGIRNGLSGPGQLRWMWTPERTPKMLTAAMRADLHYYLETATARRDKAIIARTPLSLGTSALWRYVRRRSHPLQTS